ncbi:MAG: hypothetical protein IJ637_03045 [Prevotella sp.]|nr:hypothetical protein [Prevotella sp.]
MNTLLIRNILNTIFIIGAIVGMLLYWKYDQTTGTIVILAAMCFKFTESCLRMMKRDDE